MKKNINLKTKAGTKWTFIDRNYHTMSSICEWHSDW